MPPEKVSDFNLDRSLGFVMHRALASIKAMVREGFRERGCDVTVDQWVVLCALWEKDGVSQAQLTERTCKDRPTVTRMLELLEKKGLIFRRRASSDKRVRLVHLTPEGKDFENVLVPVVLDLHGILLKGFDRAEIEQLYSLLERVHENSRK